MVSKVKPKSLSPTVQHSQRKMPQNPALSNIPISPTSNKLLLVDFLDNKKRKRTKIDDDEDNEEGNSSTNKYGRSISYQCLSPTPKI